MAGPQRGWHPDNLWDPRISLIGSISKKNWSGQLSGPPIVGLIWLRLVAKSQPNKRRVYPNILDLTVVSIQCHKPPMIWRVTMNFLWILGVLGDGGRGPSPSMSARHPTCLEVVGLLRSCRFCQQGLGGGGGLEDHPTDRSWLVTLRKSGDFWGYICHLFSPLGEL